MPDRFNTREAGSAEQAPAVWSIQRLVWTIIGLTLCFWGIGFLVAIIGFTMRPH